MDERTPPTSRRRWMPIAILGGVIALFLGVLFGASLWQQGQVRRSALAQAEKNVKAKQGGLAARHLIGYLADNPNDVEVIETLGRIQADEARSADDWLTAARTNDQLCRIDPDGPNRQETRRRVADLYIRYSDVMASSPFARVAPLMAVQQYRYGAAETVAREMVDRDPKSAVAHHLLGRALEGLARPGDRAAQDAAAREYEETLKIDPTDVEAADRLALIDDERRNDPASAARVLDRLLAARPNSPEVRLSRYFREIRLGRDDRGTVELAEAIRLAPNSPSVLIAAAEDALRHNDPGTARRRLDALPKDRQNDPRVRYLRGEADFRDERPEEAIATWRSRLMTSGGTDVEMNWILAMTLIRAGRVAEARPLVDQYRRLIGDDERPELRLLRALLEEKVGRPGAALVELELLRDKLSAASLVEVEMAIARCHLAMRDAPGAEVALKRAIKVNPKAAEPRRELARLAQRRIPQEEVAEIRRGLEVSPRDPYLRVSLAESLLTAQARLPIERRSWAEVDRAIAEVVEVLPRGTIPTRLRAIRRELAGDVDGAVKLMEAAAAESPDSEGIWTEWARLLSRAKRLKDAIAVIDRAPIDRPTLRLIRSDLLVADGRRREARETLERGIESLPTDQQHVLWKAIGDLLSEMGEREQARLVYDRWIRSAQPNDPRPRLFLMGLALRERDYPAARAYLADLKKAVGPDDSTVRLAGAEMLLRMAAGPDDAKDPKIGEALAILDGILSTSPGLAEAHLLRAEALGRSRRPEDAVVACRRARDLGHAAATPLLVSLLVSLKHYDDIERLPAVEGGADVDRLAAEACAAANVPEWASRFADRAARRDGDTTESLTWRARIYEKVGRLPEADAALLILADRRPTELAPWLDLVHVQAMRGRFAAVDATIRRAKEVVRSDPPELVEARCLWVRGDRKGAEQAFARVVDRRPDDVAALLSAAGHLWTMGRLDLAESAYRRVLKIDPENSDARRSLAVVVASGVSDAGSWDRAWAALNGDMKGPRVETIGDRVARAVVLANAPDYPRKAQAVADLRGILVDLADESREAALVREVLIRLLLKLDQADEACRVAAVPPSRSGDVVSQIIYADALVQAGRKAEAVAPLDEVARLNPGNLQEAQFRAKVLWDPAHPAESAARLEEAVNARSESPGASALGRIAFNTLAGVGVDDPAERIGRRLSAREPGLSWMTAKILARRGRDSEAFEACRMAVESGAAADAAEALRIALGIASKKPAMIAAAAPIIEAARKRFPDQPEIKAVDAGMLHLRGDYAGEVRLYREVLAAAPDEPSILNNLAWSLSEGMKQPAEGLKVIDRLIALNNRATAAYDTRGVILTRLGKFPDAIAALEAAVAYDPRPTRYFHLARAFQLAGRADDARRAKEAALRGGIRLDEVDPAERDECAAMFKR